MSTNRIIAEQVPPPWHWPERRSSQAGCTETIEHDSVTWSCTRTAGHNIHVAHYQNAEGNTVVGVAWIVRRTR